MLEMFPSTMLSLVGLELYALVERVEILGVYLYKTL